MITALVSSAIGWYAPSAFALRPFVSTDADVVDVKEWEIEFGIFGLAREDRENEIITPSLRFNYANFLYAYKRYPETMKQMQGVVKMHPDIASFRILLGYAQIAQGHRDQAMTQFRHALTLGTHDEEVRKILELYQ